jgi:tRNA 2-thiocytidine biosynthesis protein TtcA
MAAPSARTRLLSMATPIPLPMPLLRKAAHERQRLAKRLRHQVGRAIAE